MELTREWTAGSSSGGAMRMILRVFTLLAVGTSLIGTLLGFFQFFKEQLRCLPPVNESLAIDHSKPDENKLNLSAMSMAVIPALLVSTAVPDAFYFATDIAVRNNGNRSRGGYCMTVLYGMLPPAMAWSMHA